MILQIDYLNTLQNKINLTDHHLSSCIQYLQPDKMIAQKQKTSILSKIANDHFQCIICYELFNQDNRFPRVLSCGHTICEKCIFSIIDKNYQFHCPYCKTNLGQLRIGLTYKNYALLALLNLNCLKSKEEPGELTYSISKNTYEEIVKELDKSPKHIHKLIIKRLRDDEGNAFDNDLIRSNKTSMRFYKLIVKFYQLKHFELWVKYSAHGFEECLAESLHELSSLQTVKIVNAYDQFGCMNELIPLTANQKIAFDIQIYKWNA